MNTTDFVKTYANKDTEEVLELLSIDLELRQFEKYRISQYLMALEEALMVWREQFPEDQEIEFSRVQGKKRFEMFAKFEGRKVDPLAVQDETDDYATLRKRILAGCGVELRYFYENGKMYCVLDSRLIKRSSACLGGIFLR